VVVAVDRGDQPLRGGKIDMRCAQVAAGGRRGVEHILRVGSTCPDRPNRVLLPRCRQELHRSYSPIEAGIAVQSSVVGIRNCGIAVVAIKERTKYPWIGDARPTRTRGASGTRMVGLDKTDAREY